MLFVVYNFLSFKKLHKKLHKTITMTITTKTCCAWVPYQLIHTPHYLSNLLHFLRKLNDNENVLRSLFIPIHIRLQKHTGQVRSHNADESHINAIGRTSVWALSYWFCRQSRRLSDSLRVFLTRSRSSWCLWRRSSARIRSSWSRTVASFAIRSSSSSSRNRRLSSDLSSAMSIIVVKCAAEFATSSSSSSSSSSSFICQEHIQYNVQEEQIAYGRCDKAEVQR